MKNCPYCSGPVEEKATDETTSAISAGEVNQDSSNLFDITHAIVKK